MDTHTGAVPWVILPYMTHGDLLGYIRNEKNVSSVVIGVAMETMYIASLCNMQVLDCPNIRL